MFTHKDLEYKSIFVINCIKDRSLQVQNGELLLKEEEMVLTKMPFQKILALFVIGHIKITTPLIEKCQKFNVCLIVVKPNFRPVFYWANNAEANYLLRQKQYLYRKEDITIASWLVKNKIQNQIKALNDTRKKDVLTTNAIVFCKECLSEIDLISDYNSLMGIEGNAAKIYFQAFYQEMGWHSRKPRTKCDILNATLDIGYTILFNYIECFIRMFGFDPYIGVYHRLWFKRKSLICDIMEPFRCIIDKATRTAFNRKQFSNKDFREQKGEYYLKIEKNADYSKVYFDALIPYKKQVFIFIQSFYRAFMQGKTIDKYPLFEL